MAHLRRFLGATLVAALLVGAAALALPARPGLSVAAASTSATSSTAVSSTKPKKKPAPLTHKQRAALRAKIAAYVKTRHGETTTSFYDETTGTSFTYAASRRIDTASIVKADILATLELRHQHAHTSLTADERALAVRMIEHSDNTAATALWNRIDGSAGLRKANKTFGLVQTQPRADEDWGLTTTSAADQVRLLRVFTEKASALSVARRAYVLGLMRHVTSDQHWGVSVAGDKATATDVKNGWLPRSTDGYRWVINSIGHVHIGTHVVLIAVLSRRSTSMGSGIETVEHLAGLVRTAVRTS